jgi:hypothetical protein
MKTNIKFVLITAIMALSACGEDLVKDDIDAVNAGDKSKLPTVTISSPQNVTYEGADVAASWSNAGDEIIEAGFIYSNNESFIPAEAAAVKEIAGTNINMALSLDPVKTYYIKAYVLTKSNGVAFSNDVVSLTTPAAPVFEDTYLFGKYTALDIDLTTGEPEGGEYEITITQKQQSYNRVNISNIWGGGRTVEGIVNFENKTISIASTEVIYVDSDYGNTFMWAIDIVDGQVQYKNEPLAATYDSDGNITFGYWAAHVSAGNFGYYVTILEKK